MAFVQKDGKHGTLYRYEIKYRDESDDSPTFTTHTWAYNYEHAEINFAEGPDSDGWEICSISRVRS